MSDYSDALRRYIYGRCKLHCLNEEGRGSNSDDFVEADYLTEDLDYIRNHQLTDEEWEIANEIGVFLCRSNMSGFGGKWPHGFMPIDSSNLTNPVEIPGPTHTFEDALTTLEEKLTDIEKRVKELGTTPFKLPDHDY